MAYIRVKLNINLSVVQGHLGFCLVVDWTGGKSDYDLVVNCKKGAGF